MTSKALLLLFGVFLAWKTRNVHIYMLSDSKNFNRNLFDKLCVVVLLLLLLFVFVHFRNMFKSNLVACTADWFYGIWSALPFLFCFVFVLCCVVFCFLFLFCFVLFYLASFCLNVFYALFHFVFDKLGVFSSGLFGLRTFLQYLLLFIVLLMYVI